MANPCALPTALLAISTPPRAKGTPQGLSTPHGNFGDHSAKMPTEPTKQTSPRKLGHLAVRTKNSGPKCLLKCTSRSRSEPHCRSHCTGVYCTGVLLHGCQPGVMPARSHASQESCQPGVMLANGISTYSPGTWSTPRPLGPSVLLTSAY